MKKPMLALAVCAVPLVLSGCSGEPSASEVRDSVSVFVTELGKIIAPRAQRPLIAEKVEKLGCTPVVGATYTCDVTMTLSGGHMPEAATRTSPMKFTKAEGRWLASE